MRHYIFEDASQEEFPIVLLIKDSAFNPVELVANYAKPLVKNGVSLQHIIAFDLLYEPSGKAPSSLIKAYLDKLLPALKKLGTRFIYCADANYFKALTKARKAEPHLGEVLPCGVSGFEEINVILGVNHKSLVYNPANEEKLMMSVNTLSDAVQNNHKPVGEDIIHNAYYPEEHEIESYLLELHQFPALVVDIETFSLRFNEAGIATICFCWNQHEGVAFEVDYVPFTSEHSYLDKLEILGICPEAKPKDTLKSYLERCEKVASQYYGYQVDNPRIKRILRSFFKTYNGKLLFHNCPFDTKVMIYELWMQNLLDTKGLLEGLHILYRDIEDTKIIKYLATNSTAGNELSLKVSAQEFAGNWAQDEIKDVRKIPLNLLRKYNLIDGLATWFVFNKYYPIMQEDEQEHLYKTLMMPSQKVITQVELSGMPMDRDKVREVRQKLEGMLEEEMAVFQGKAIINHLEDNLTYDAWQRDFESRKAKAKNPDKILPKKRATFPRVPFNPNSVPQLQRLLYIHMKLPVIDKTVTKQPATGAETVEKLIHHCTDPEHKAILQALINHGKISKILSAFIPAFEDAILKEDGHYYLHGSFNLGGTVSGRLSSSDPNLQNIPSGSTFGKLIKECFKAPPDWIFSGADFNSLEDYISALTTKDPNKLKVYLEGYDGHCLRAFSYFPDRLPDIQDTVESINSIKDKYPEVRQDSKGPTFALTISALAA